MHRAQNLVPKVSPSIIEHLESRGYAAGLIYPAPGESARFSPVLTRKSSVLPLANCRTQLYCTRCARCDCPLWVLPVLDAPVLFLSPFVLIELGFTN